MDLEVRNIHVHYGPLEAVRGVSMRISGGKIVGLLGANGSGKSTILKAISGLKRPTRGEIWLDGRRIDGKPPYWVIKQGIVLVPEGRRVFPSLTVLENLEMGAYSRKDKAGIKQDLEEVFLRFPRLKERRSQRAGTLSGGEQGMLAIGRGLMARPQILLMDEPLQGLSPLIIDEFQEIISGLNRGGLTILIVEHNVHFTLGLSDMVYILEIGEVAHQGHPTELSETEYVQKVYLAG